MHRVLLILTLILWPAFAAAGVQNIAQQGDLTTLEGEAFGTSFHMKLTRVDLGTSVEQLRASVDEAIDRLNSQMSLWDDSSELSGFNADTTTDWFPVSGETVAVVEAALHLRQRTSGAFDPTVRPLLSLWSFGPGDRPQQVPSPSDLAAALALVGAEVETRRHPEPGLRKIAPQVQLDLNALAKGFAVDRFCDIASEVAPQGVMVEIGGEVCCRGTRPDGSPWRIAIEQPIAGTRRVESYVELQDAALATSGDYRNYFESAGKRYSHTIDPRTGRPIEHNLASVSVVADDCMTADAWATALMVLGPDAGYNLARQEGVAAHFVARENGVFVQRSTTGFPELIPLTATAPMIPDWTTFLIAGAVFALAVGGMAVGVILSNRQLRGSCGGLNGLKDAQGNPMCEACTTPPEECDEFRQKMAASASSQVQD